MKQEREPRAESESREPRAESKSQVPRVSDHELRALPSELWHSHPLHQLLLSTFIWLLILMWYGILRENAMTQSFFETKPDGAQSAPNSLFNDDSKFIVLPSFPTNFNDTFTIWLLLQYLDDQPDPFSTTTSSWLSSWYWLLLLREHELLCPSWLLGAVIPKYPFTSAKIVESFVGE